MDKWFSESTKAIQWRKREPFQQMVLEREDTHGRMERRKEGRKGGRKEGDLSLTPYTKINSKWIISRKLKKS